MSNFFATPWTVAHQAPLSMGFPSKNTGVGCHFLLQGIVPAHGSNSHLLLWQADSLPLSHQGNPVAFLFYHYMILDIVRYHQCIMFQFHEKFGTKNNLLNLRPNMGLPGGAVVRNSSSNAGGAGSIPGWGVKMEHASWPKNKA